jgi:hypothetical protein
MEKHMHIRKINWMWSVILLLFTTCCLLSTAVFAQITFERTYGDTADDYGYSVQQTSDGGYIIAGGTESFGLGSYDVYLIKTDSLGDTLWTMTYGGVDYDNAYSVYQTSDDGYIIGGSTWSFGSGRSDFYLIRTDSSGETLWTKAHGDTFIDWGRTVQQTFDGGFIIAGVTAICGSCDFNFYLVRINSLGDTLWTRIYGGPGGDWGWSCQQTSDGGFVIVGQTSSFGSGANDVWLIKTNSLGDTLWTRTYGDFQSEVGYSVQETFDGGYIIAGSKSGDVYMVKTDSLGGTLWSRTIGGSGWHYCRSVQQTSDGGFICVGETESFGSDSTDFYLVRVNPLGDTLWTKTYGGPNDDWGYSVQQTSDGGFVVTGCKNCPSQSSDVYLIKTDENGMVVGVEEESSEFGIRIAEFRLKRNFPNPFNKLTTISYQLKATSHTTLEIYDITGRLVETLVNEHKEPGVYQVKWNGRDQASGIYFYRIRSREFVDTRKMVLLK